MRLTEPASAMLAEVTAAAARPAGLDLKRRGAGVTIISVAARDRILRLPGARWRVLTVVALLVVARASVAQTPPVARPACAPHRFEGTQFTVCTFDARRNELRIAWQRQDGTALRGFAALADDLGGASRRVQFAMNGGMFDDRGAPIGILVAGGATLHPLETHAGSGNFYLQPNGVFSLDRDGAVHVEPTGAYAARHAAPVWATQSGPMLVIDGALHPSINDDGSSRKVRNGVGARDAHTAVFVISDAPVSFGRLARLFRDELGCRDALFLDGTVSSAWIPAAGRLDSDHALGPLVVVLAR